ncbi:MAG: hypothetical protein CLLPBCKN_000468 [Chroococcidiopsis cubana SAG 39.79]|uniref:Uncharacterized protein n=1 Tax=Chroococcidiopsis cubana SAG 39.79 TaxID=388085 RepID=A0AB37UP02_9CYAN|nr:hypothetical protein [Chroococcidiopsis cubana]MDZ4871080.1 hypothetical protein [Chroococcidiopsis cubana SAG 39.79]PSB64109.1 hypothetical protein C7B79_11145 [Chroococcidiopsis cubana CCALA 043]RUT13142.1 hypothetical protein DSM107010_16980 [Chroococcidiopsis cubana SAG 39.79]
MFLPLLYPENQLDEYDAMVLDNLLGLDLSANAEAKHDQGGSYQSYAILKPTEGGVYKAIEVWTKSDNPLSVLNYIRSLYHPSDYYLLHLC